MTIGNSARVDVLLMQPLAEPIDALLTGGYCVHRIYEAKDRDAFLNEVGSRIRAVVTGGGIGLASDLMARLPALQIVAINGVGVDAVDLIQASQRGIHVTTTPGALTDDVADMAMGLIISTLRRLCEGDRVVREGLWGKVRLPLARKVTGVDLGIIGLGRIGRAIARRAAAFDMRIAYSDIREQPESGYRYVPSLEDLARSVDVLVVAASAEDNTVIVTAAVIDALGPSGYLINVARGKLVDEQALIVALQQGRIAGAGLDVFGSEPLVTSSLCDLPQVTLQPHRASATLQTRLEMGRMVLENLAACFRGELPPHRVSGG